MKAIISSIMLAATISLPAAAQDVEFSYEEIAKRFPDTQLSADSVTEARMHGECLVGLKQLIFVKRDYFDPVAEWINYRTNSLLEQIPPCDVLVMMEVARRELMGAEEAAP